MCVVCASLGDTLVHSGLLDTCVCVVCASLGDTIVHSGLLDICVCGMCVTGGYISPQWITGYL